MTIWIKLGILWLIPFDSTDRVLSLTSPSWYFIELAGWFTEYVLPLGWHTPIN